ncbi:Glycine-betaine-L-proline ABC transporter periplasmic-binding protein [Salinisphaera shabanensis E1L3A]|uniref:Glycine-betaine-L-proline ABC transporter periplasmic-binding protein n=1 Tax=Salinisphaera shabanensis E1L3A TaxID=1033802 RepID=U2G1Y9_9GAMM|nr:glycine betaine ABC transporter substrate-binding protein [Salinisphaera shabanensis]ERJ20238.1 Glycine-betaine-L-proline ABC transporter periplasmic-binding protein [Salinisphaera shabanensis E1L3A]
MHKHSFKHWLGTAAMAASLTFGAMGSAQAADDTIEFGWTAWSDAEFITKLAKQVIEEHTDYNVKLTLSAIGVQYQGVANGDLDAMLMAWLPDTHADYMDRVKDDVDNLGTMYEGARLGWVVPSYVPEDQVASIEDLKKAEVQEKLDGKIQGIDPGAGLMQLSNDTMEEYGLGDYRLVSASGAAMTAALARAEKRDEWIVVTGWTPHWMFGRWDLRFLDDPKGTLGEAQHVDVIARKGFKKDYPEVAAFLSNYKLNLEDLQAAMDEAQKTSYEEAIQTYIEENGEQIEGWFEQS